MIEIISNITSQDNVSTNKNNSFFNIINSSYLLKSTFSRFNQYFLNKKIEFDHIIAEEKKENKDKIVISSHFIVNYLLNILNQKNTDFNSKNFNNSKNDKIKKKKIDNNQVNLLDTVHFFRNTKNTTEKKILRELIKHKNNFNKIHESNNINIKNDLDFKNLKNQTLQKKINVFNTIKNHIKIINNEEKIILPLNIKKNKKIVFYSKNINKINPMISKRHSCKILSNKKEFIKSYIEPFMSSDTKNSIEWKKLISHKILLSISNKYNQAKIHLKPESLGSIYVSISMKNNIATLKFISEHNEVKTFLDSYMPFLYNSLKKNGIKLKEFKISISSKKNQLKNYKNLFYKNIYYTDHIKKTLNWNEKKIDYIKDKTIDVYV